MLYAPALRGLLPVVLLLIGSAGALYAQKAPAQPGLANDELRQLYEQDQADRRQRPIDWAVVSEKDRRRRNRVRQMIDADSLVTAADFFHASMIFQHGQDSTDYLLARDLARHAVSLDSTHALARQMTAMAQDRYLWSVGKPQWYGTQSIRHKGEFWTIEPIDTIRVTDADREALGLIPLKIIRADLVKKNAAIKEQVERERKERDTSN